jgi:hypothetical protein
MGRKTNGNARLPVNLKNNRTATSEVPGIIRWDEAGVYLVAKKHQ